MARIDIGTGLWSVLRGYLNSMFIELYALTASAPGNYVTITQTLTAEDTTTVITTLTSKPRTIEIFDSTGILITHLVGIKTYLSGGFYNLDIYNGGDELSNTEINITY